ncbi:MAG: TA system VapC family ribonuclease toxin [Verrucomicrobiae bacterium]
MIAVDTNVLVHAHQREASLHGRANEVLRRLAESPTPWAICWHCLVEFYGVVTHPKIWKQPTTPHAAINQIAAWRESPSLRLICDSHGTLDTLSALAVAGEVRGALIHDARIAASCLTAGITELWTVDRDFSRFPALKIRNPLVTSEERN